MSKIKRHLPRLPQWLCLHRNIPVYGIEELLLPEFPRAGWVSEDCLGTWNRDSVVYPMYGRARPGDMHNWL